MSVCFLVKKWTSDKLLFARWTNGQRINENRLGFRFPCPVSCPCLCSRQYFHVLVRVHLYIYVHAHIHVHFHVHVYFHVTLLQTEIETNGKQQLPFVCCKRKTEMANFCLFAANENGKRKFVEASTTRGTTKEALYTRMETAICICPSSGGGRFEYITWFCTE